MKLPAFQFYPGDWRKDTGVQSLDYEARGVWMEILCLMHESERRGILTLNGKAMPDEALSRLLGIEVVLLKQILSKLEAHGVASREQDSGALLSRRMVRDENIRKVRSEAGKQGGNPLLLKQNPTTGVNQIPTPSSSSSASTNIEREQSRPKNIEVAVEFGKSQGYDEQVTRKWFFSRDSQEWVKDNDKPITNWKSDLGSWVIGEHNRGGSKTPAIDPAKQTWTWKNKK